MANEWFLKVNPHAVECDSFRKAISADSPDTFISFIDLDNAPTCYFIRGKPYRVDDGDDCYDDMSGSEEIFFCPFCGKGLVSL